MKMDDCIITTITEWPPPEEHCHDANENDEKHEEKTNKRLKREFTTIEYPEVDKTLAVWFRKNASELRKKYKLPTVSNPKTILNAAADLPEGKDLLKRKLNELISEKSDTNPSIFYAIAKYQDKLGFTKEALCSVKQCLQILGISVNFMEVKSSYLLKEIIHLSEFEKNVLWLFSKLNMEAEMINVPKRINESNQLEVTKVNANALDLDAFKRDYCATKTPVVIIDAESPTLVPWTREHIAEQAAGCTAEVKIPVAGSSEWAGLEGAGRANVAEFIRDKIPGHYLFDWSLSLHCLQLAAEFTVPTYFLDDYLKRTSCHALYHSSWPSLFVAPAGTNSGLHIDAFGSHFWMYLVSGKKLWTFYPSHQAGLLGPRFIDSTDPVFSGGDGALARAYTVTLCPGEWLFVPAGSPHKVDNLEDSVAVSANFVNDTNIEDVEKHLKINSLLDPRAFDLLKEFVDLSFVK